MTLPLFILPHVVPFAVVVARLTGLFIFSPVISSAQVPTQVKAMLVLGLSFIIYPTLGAGVFAHVGGLDLLTVAPLMATELLIGLVIGIIAITPTWGVQLAGVLMGQQMGLSLAQVYNPAVDIEGDTLGQVLFLLALALFISMGGIESMFSAVTNSFAAVAPGGFRADAGVVRVVAGMVESGVQLAMRVAMPVMAIVLVESVSVGFVSKTLPSLNVMSFGFPVRIILGIGVLILGLGGVKQAMVVHIERTVAAVDDFGAAPNATAPAALIPTGAPGG